MKFNRLETFALFIKVGIPMMTTQDSHIEESVAIGNEEVTFGELAVEASICLQQVPDDFNSAYGIDGRLGTSSSTGTAVLSLDTLLHRYLSPWRPIAFLGLGPETRKHRERKVKSGSAKMRAVFDSEIERPPERKLIGFNSLDQRLLACPKISSAAS